MRTFAAFAALVTALFAAFPGASSAADTGLEARARAIHAQVLTLDSHVDVLVPGEPGEFGPNPVNQASLDQLQRGGIDAVAFAIAVGPGPRTAAGVAAARAEADTKLRLIRGLIRDNPSKVALALSAEDVRRIHRQGKIAVIESFLNARSLGQNLDGIDEFYRAGVRLFGFVHAGNNDFADSSRPIGEPAQEFHGLSPLGKQAVAKLNRLGVIIDVSPPSPPLAGAAEDPRIIRRALEKLPEAPRATHAVDGARRCVGRLQASVAHYSRTELHQTAMEPRWNQDETAIGAPI